MSDRWYISDTHFSHENIIKYTGRPFANVVEMDQFMIEQWNSVVKPQDHITHLGDVTMRRGGKTEKEWLIKTMKSLHGHKRLHLGNHDHFPVEVYLEAGFEKVYATWRSDERIIFSHIPIHPNSLGKAVANVHGHIHEKDDYPPHKYEWEGKTVIIPYINICVEKTEYRPIHLDEILERITQVKDKYRM